jgi:plasmid stabilization system protein ParE
LAFEVLISPTALADAEEYVAFIRSDRQQPLGAQRWWNGLLEAIFSLESMPQRCPIISKTDQYEDNLRHLIYFSHRIIFAIDGNQVMILRIRHVSRHQIR